MNWLLEHLLNWLRSPYAAKIDRLEEIVKIQADTIHEQGAQLQQMDNELTELLQSIAIPVVVDAEQAQG